VSSLHAYLAAFFERSQPLHVTVSQLNKALYRDVTEDKFVTAFFALLDPATGGLECLSAGHNPAFLLKKTGPLVLLHTGGLPLASVDLDIPYESEHVAMDKGDRLFLYTDGITEAENAAGEMFERITPFEEYIVGVKAKSARGFIDEVVGDVRHFAAGYPQNDDVTAIYLMRL
jgi:sigma-B regulation protein RsbU (phosphoserine phosphatase)